MTDLKAPTDEEAEKLRALSDKATPGDWEIQLESPLGGPVTIFGPDDMDADDAGRAIYQPPEPICTMADTHRDVDNADFIAACIHHVRRALASPGSVLRPDGAPLKGLDLLEAHTLAGLRLYLTIRLRAARAEAALEANGEEAMARWQAEVGDLEAYLDLIGPEGVREAYGRMLAELKVEGVTPPSAALTDVKAAVERLTEVVAGRARESGQWRPDPRTDDIRTLIADHANLVEANAILNIMNQQRVAVELELEAEHEADLATLSSEITRLRAALEPFAKFRLDGFDGTVLEVVPSDPDNPARRIEPIWKEHFERARAALQSPNVTDSAHT